MHKAITFATIIPACTILWNFIPIPIDYTAMGVLAIFIVSGVLKFEQAFAFASSANCWVVWSGMIVGAAVRETGLEGRLATNFRTGHFTQEIVRILFFGIILALLLPSAVVRVCIMLPVAMNLAKESCYSKLKTECLLVTSSCAAVFPGVGILTAALPNLIVANEYEHLIGTLVR